MRNERREAKLDGAKLVKNSGRGESKGDATLTLGPSQLEYLVDYKHYESTFSVSKKAWNKLARDAWNAGHREPVIKVCYDGVELAIISWPQFVYLNEGFGYDQ